MIILFWLCILGTLGLSALFWFGLDNPVHSLVMIGSLVISSGIFGLKVGRGLLRQRRDRAHLLRVGGHLAFAFNQSLHSRVADDRGGRRIDGTLYAFRRRADRDAWVADTPPTGKRTAVTPSKLPAGWSIRDARPIDDDDNTALPAAYFAVRFQPRTTTDTWPQQFAIISAQATTGERWSPQRNHCADRRLTAFLARRGCWRRRLTGYAADGNHAEAGWAVALSAEEARALGRRLRQHAIYLVDDDRLTVVTCHDPAHTGPDDSFRRRLDPVPTTEPKSPKRRKGTSLNRRPSHAHSSCRRR